MVQPNNKEEYFLKKELIDIDSPEEKTNGNWIKNIVESHYHTQILAPTGTAASIQMLNMVTTDVLRDNTSVVLMEPFNDLTLKIKNLCENKGLSYRYIDPCLEHPDTINIFEGENIEQIANMHVEVFLSTLTKDTPQFYKDTQGQYLYLAICCLKEVEGNQITYSKIDDFLCPLGADYRKEVMGKLKEIDKQELYQRLLEYHVRFLETESPNRMEQNIQGLLDYLKKIKNNKLFNAVTQTNSFSLEHALDKGETILFSTEYHQLGIELSSILGKLIEGKLKLEAWKRLCKEENERKTLSYVNMYIDEMQHYVERDFIETIFEIGKQVSFKLTVKHQDTEQLQKFADTVFNNCLQKIVFGGTKLNDCKKISDLSADQYQANEIYSLPAFNPFNNTPCKAWVKQIDNSTNNLKYSIQEIEPLYSLDWYKPSK